jgi:hypothetical protein
MSTPITAANETFKVGSACSLSTACAICPPTRRKLEVYCIVVLLIIKNIIITIMSIL